MHGKSRLNGLSQLLQQRLCAFRILQVPRVEAFGEPVVDGLEQSAGLVVSSPVAEQVGQARGGAKFDGLRLSLPSDLECAAEALLCLLGVSLLQQDLSLQPSCVQEHSALEASHLQRSGIASQSR